MVGLTTTPFDQLMQQINSLPLWVKQVVYTQLRFELENAISKSTLGTFGPEHTLQLMVPDLTRAGVQELQAPSGQFPQGLLKLLHLAHHKKNVINIAAMNQWSLEQCAVYLQHALQAQLILPPKSGIIQATIEYLAGKTRLGEYLVKINRVTFEQLDQALRTQKYIETSMGERTGIANVLINLGYINKVDSEGILFLKEESKTPFPPIGSLGIGGAPAGQTANAGATAQLQQQLQMAMNRIRELEALNQQLQGKS